jgi:hypothetical protein
MPVLSHIAEHVLANDGTGQALTLILGTIHIGTNISVLEEDARVNCDGSMLMESRHSVSARPLHVGGVRDRQMGVDGIACATGNRDSRIAFGAFGLAMFPPAPEN